ncbi:MAG: PilZ domain-containing protein [Candidatus Omnitrophota bacterium]
METRLSTRILVELKVVSKIEESAASKFSLASGNVFEATAVDISETGISLSSKFFLPAQLVVQLNFDTGSFGIPGTLSIKGEVRHCENLKESGYKVGIHFLDIPDTFRAALSHYIASNEHRKV